MRHKDPKSILAWALLDGGEIMYIGGCDPDSTVNHLEIFKYYREARRAIKDVEGTQTIVKCLITFTVPKKPK